MTRYAVLLCAILAAGCNRGMLPLAPVAGPVVFTLSVDAKAFSNKKQISVAIYDAEQLAIMQETGGCTASVDANGKETVSCPPGVTYRKATPEETFVSRDELAKGLTLVSRTVVVGERYRVSVGGMAADDCNRASATQEGVATSANVKLDELQVATTMRACQPTRGQ